jgi:hypothetical protein
VKRNGVVITVSPKYAEMVTESESISGRVMKIKILMKQKEMNILQIYAPQTGCSNEQKEFKEISDDKTSGEYISIIGDFNAQIGKDRKGHETIWATEIVKRRIYSTCVTETTVQLVTTGSRKEAIS